MAQFITFVTTKHSTLGKCKIDVVIHILLIPCYNSISDNHFLSFQDHNHKDKS